MTNNLNQMLSNIVKYFTLIKDVSKFKRYDSPHGNDINFSRNNNQAHEVYLFSTNEPSGEIQLLFEIKTIEKGEPYRHDPGSRIAPSAYYIKKTSKKKLNKFFDSETKAIKAINKFFGL